MIIIKTAFKILFILGVPAGIFCLMNRRKSIVFTYFITLVAILCALSGVTLLIEHFIKEVEAEQGNSAYVEPLDGDVLCISSYDPRYLITQKQFEGLNSEFEKAGIVYEIMYMDMLNYDTRENYELFCRLVRHKVSMRKKPYQVVVVSDDAALNFIQQYKDQLFKDTPIVFFGVNNIDRAKEAQKDPWITGFPEHIFVEETLELMIEQNPNVEKIYCLHDDSLTGRGDKAQFERAIKKYPNLSFEFLTITRNSKERFKERLSEIKENDAILCLSSLQSYAHKNAMSVYDLINLINSVIENKSVYRTNIVGLGNGFLGGKIFDHYKAGIHAAQIVEQILKGKNISEFDEDDYSVGEFVFDYQKVKDFKINSSTLPKDTIFINKPVNFVKELREVLIPFCLIVLALIFTVFIFLGFYERSKKINKIVMAMNKRMRQINKDLIESKTKLTFAANNDGLTGLPNRSYGDEEIRRMVYSGIPFTLFLMDVDDFKNYNDTYTHECGDYVLKEFGRRLKGLTATGEWFAARHGGDEFLLAYKCGHIEKNGAMIEMLRQILNAPIDYKNNHLSVTATLGYADSSPDITFDDLITNADIAMYQAKGQGSGVCLGFIPDMRESRIKRNQIRDLLKIECDTGGFELRYQPQVSTANGEVAGYEALVRLRDYKIGPDEFIPVAENTGFITQIGRIVTQKVLQDMNSWRAQGMPLKKVAINFSNGQLVDKGYVGYLKTLLDRYQIPADLIEIEITESLFMGKKTRAKQLFNDFAEIGVGLALDDFGTGYSSLSYLTFVPADKVKIDKSLVDNYLVEGKESFIQNIVHLVHGLGMKLTVEGVEHKWQYDKLCQMQCDYIQGYLFSKPMVAGSVPDFSVLV